MPRSTQPVSEEEDGEESDREGEEVEKDGGEEKVGYGELDEGE